MPKAEYDPLKPTFVVIGAPKCATTAVCDLLSSHPEVFVTEPKEPHFFNDPDHWAWGFGWYRSLFEEAASYPARGEGSVFYAATGVYPHTVDRLADYAPDVRLVYMIRHPLERIISHWVGMRVNGRTALPLEEALREEPILLDCTRYHAQIQAYTKRFSPERIHVELFEDFRADPDAVLARICRHIGVDSEHHFEDAHQPRNVTAGKRMDGPLLTAARRYLPGFGHMRDALPGDLRQRLKQRFKSNDAQKPTWCDADRQWVIDQLEADTKAALEFAGKPVDTYKWDTP